MNEELTADERILAALNQDLEPIAPDGGKMPQPKAPEINEDLNPRLDLVEPVKGDKDPDPDPSGETLDEGELLKQYKLEGRYTKIEDALGAFSKTRETVDTIAQLMKKAGLDPSDDPVQDLADLLEAKLAEDAGLTSGAPPKAAPPDPKQAPRPISERVGDGARNFMARYPSLKWNEPFLKDLAQALRDDLGIPEVPKTDDFASRGEVQRLEKMNRHLFEQALMQDHVIGRLNNGDKLPPDYRQRLAEQVERNPALMERAIRGYLIRGRATDVMSEYAKLIPVQRDPSTGLTEAEKLAKAEEHRLEANRRRLSGGNPPAKSGGKESQPSLRDLENAIEKAGRALI